MDILEAGMDRPEREPSRRRSSALIALAVVVGGGAWWLQRPDAPVPQPEPVAVSASPTPTPTLSLARPKPVKASPAPKATVYPFTAQPVAVRSLDCGQFLADLGVLRDHEWGLTLINDKRTPRSRVVTYRGRGGTARTEAHCGPTVWGGPIGQHVGDDNEEYIDPGARSGEDGGPRPSVAIFRAANADGWYQITAGGPNGRLGDGATLRHLMAGVAHVQLINWSPPGAAGQD